MKIAVLGAGAMGCLYGSLLKKAGQDVTLIDVNLPHMQAINSNGLRILRKDQEEFITISACRADEYRETADVVIVFTKSIYSVSALSSVAHAICQETLMVSFQNGLGHEHVLGAYADANHIVIGTTNFPSDLQGYGVIASNGSGVTRMMTVSGVVTEQVRQFYAVLEDAGLNPELSADVFSAIWEKVAFNAALNSLTAITMLPLGYLGQTEDGRVLAHKVVDETICVAANKGIQVDGEDIHRKVDHALLAHFDHCPSMLQDVLKKRCTESEYINGAIAKEAERLGIDVPVTRTLYQLLNIIQQTYKHRLPIE